ncbi:hypothetical protein DSECCO2_363020 [anaerobic digester metagenome]
MLESIKKIAKQTGDAEVPARFMSGTVTKLSPLTVCVDNRFYVTAPALKCLKELRGHRHNLPAHSTQTAAQHSHEITLQQTSTVEALSVNDKVFLLRNHGGQEYLILGRE